MSNEVTRYNGWTNYETWNVNLWIGNDESSDTYWREQAQDAWDRSEAEEPLTREDAATIDLAERLKSDFEDAKESILETQKLSASVWADLLGAALSEVNWDEIAGMLLNDVSKSSALN